MSNDHDAATTPEHELLLALADADPDSLAELFGERPDIDDAFFGRCVGDDAVRRLAQGWRSATGASSVALTPAHVTPAGDRVLAEFVAELDGAGEEGPIRLPMAVVGERAGDGILRAARVYYATHGLTGRLEMRPKLLADDPTARFPPPVARYQRALRDSDLDGVLACFADDATAFVGQSPVFSGRNGIRDFFTGMFDGGGGGFELEHPWIGDDGSTCILEFTAVRWGGRRIVPQAGVAAYAYGNDRLHAVRIYDDITPDTPVLDRPA